MIKKILSIFLTVALLAAMLSVFSVPAFADVPTESADVSAEGADVSAEGVEGYTPDEPTEAAPEGTQWLINEGDNHVWWKLDSGTLNIGGEGAMPAFMSDQTDDRPWSKDADVITTVIIDSGVTTLGKSAFIDFENLTSVSIPSSVTSIGGLAFSLCNSLTSITVKASTPPTLEDGSLFPYVNLAVYVPYGMGSAYINADNCRLI